MGAVGLDEVLAAPDQPITARVEPVGPEVGAPQEHGRSDSALGRIVVQRRIASSLVLDQPFDRQSGLEGERLSTRMETVLKLVKMRNFQHKKVRECSKGMLQRLSLAQALIHDPAFLILDEPITGLDPLGLSEMRDLLLELNRQGKTILFSSHIISEVEKIAHSAAILVNGELKKVLTKKEWSAAPGQLEKIFVETVRGSGELAGE